MRAARHCVAAPRKKKRPNEPNLLAKHNPNVTNHWNYDDWMTIIIEIIRLSDGRRV